MANGTALAEIRTLMEQLAESGTRGQGGRALDWWLGSEGECLARSPSQPLQTPPCWLRIGADNSMSEGSMQGLLPGPHPSSHPSSTFLWLKKKAKLTQPINRVFPCMSCLRNFIFPNETPKHKYHLLSFPQLYTMILLISVNGLPQASI